MAPRDGEEGATGVVIAAAGSGRRFGKKKQYLELLGRPILHWSLSAFSSIASVRQIVVVVPAADLEHGRGVVERWSLPRASLSVGVIAGGARRQDSVLRGLEALAESIALAMVHDGARPLVRAVDIRRVLDEIAHRGAAALGHPAHDSLKREEGGRIVEDIAREHLWAVQTPQGARRDLLVRAYRAAAAIECADEAAALRLAGADVVLVEGARDNVKVTRPGDESLAESILRARGVQPPA